MTHANPPKPKEIQMVGQCAKYCCPTGQCAKYVCPSCHAAVWGKPEGVNIRCLDCNLEPFVQCDSDPTDYFEPSLIDAITHIVKLEVDMRDFALRSDLIKAGIDVPARDEDEDEDEAKP